MPEALKSQEWIRAARIFSAGDSTREAQISAAGAEDATAWSANKAMFPFLVAVAGEKVTKVGILVAAAAGFLNCPFAVGEMAAAAVLLCVRCSVIVELIGGRVEHHVLGAADAITVGGVHIRDGHMSFILCDDSLARPPRHQPALSYVNKYPVTPSGRIAAMLPDGSRVLADADSPTAAVLEAARKRHHCREPLRLVLDDGSSRTNTPQLWGWGL